MYNIIYSCLCAWTYTLHRYRYRHGTIGWNFVVVFTFRLCSHCCVSQLNRSLQYKILSLLLLYRYFASCCLKPPCNDGCAMHRLCKPVLSMISRCHHGASRRRHREHLLLSRTHFDNTSGHRSPGTFVYEQSKMLLIGCFGLPRDADVTPLRRELNWRCTRQHTSFI